MVLTSNGEILTNNHVVDGATSITVTVVSHRQDLHGDRRRHRPDRRRRRAQLSNASGLKTAKISTTAKRRGRRRGHRGRQRRRDRRHAECGQRHGDRAEPVDHRHRRARRERREPTGLIESNAPIQAGDSGGPLYNASGEIIGIDTAGSSSRLATRHSAARDAGLRDPDRPPRCRSRPRSRPAQAISTIHLGYPAFLGVRSRQQHQRRLGGAALRVGAVASGRRRAPRPPPPVSSPATRSPRSARRDQLADRSVRRARAYKAGQSVKITLDRRCGSSHTATVT